MKKIFILITAAVFLTSLSLSVAAGDSSKLKIKALVDDEPARELDMLLVDKKGYLRIDDVADIFKAKLKPGRKPGEKVLDFTRGKVIFTVDSPYVIINWIRRKMNKRPLSIEGETWVPLEGVISSAFVSVVGRAVTWNYSTKTLRVIKKSEKKEKIEEEIKKAVNITSINVYPHRNYTRSVIRLSEDLTYKFTRVEDKKLFLRVHNGSVDTETGTFIVGDDIIKGIKSIQDTDSVLIELELGENAGGHIVEKKKRPLRIVVDITKKEEKEKEDEGRKTASAKKRIRTIVIDPGHGGKDPGAIGPRGTKEKDVVLRISRQLAKFLKKNLKCRVIMTRSSDIFIPLAQRTEIANQKKADLFISVHVNASLRKNTRGFEIYFLSEKATDDEAQAVANKENSVIDLEGDAGKSNELYKILREMAIYEFINDSSEACSFMSKSVSKRGRLINRGVKQAGFHVLRGAEMPAVLIECAFISNPTEEKRLRNSAFQNWMAKSIGEGIKEYKKWAER